MKTLVIVDMLNGFLVPGHPLYCGDHAREIIPNVVALAEEFAAAEWPILHARDEHMANDPELAVFEPHCLINSDESEEIEELSLKPITDIPKRTVDGFYKTQLDKWLRYYGCTEAFVAGVCTDICVHYVVAGLFVRGIPVTVFEDCVATFSHEDIHEAALVHMRDMLGATVECWDQQKAEEEK